MNYIKEHKLEPNNLNFEANISKNEPNNLNFEANISELSRKILSLLSVNPMTNKELLEHINASKSTLLRTTKQLKEIGKIEYIGSNRKGYWKIK